MMTLVYTLAITLSLALAALLSLWHYRAAPTASKIEITTLASLGLTLAAFWAAHLLNGQ